MSLRRKTFLVTISINCSGLVRKKKNFFIRLFYLHVEDPDRVKVYFKCSTLKTFDHGQYLEDKGKSFTPVSPQEFDFLSFRD